MPTLVVRRPVRRHRRARLFRLQAQRRPRRDARRDEEGQRRRPAKEEPISTALALDLLRIELGYGLLPLINDVQGHRITDQIKALRRQLAQEMGFVMPAVRILDNMQFGANEYRIRVKEVDAGKRRIVPRQLLVMDPKGLPIDLPGTHTTEPAFGLPATWVRQRCARKPAFRGFTVVDPRHRADHPSDRSAQEPTCRASVLCRDARSCSTICRPSRRSWWRN